MTAYEDIRKFLAALGELDDTDFEFDVSTRSIRSAQDKPGREKYKAKRIVKKLNRHLKTLERKGVSFEELLDAGKPPVEVVSEDGEAEVVVLSPGAELDWREGESAVIVETGEHTITAGLPFDAGSVEKTDKLGATLFRVTEE